MGNHLMSKSEICKTEAALEYEDFDLKPPNKHTRIVDELYEFSRKFSAYFFRV